MTPAFGLSAGHRYSIALTAPGLKAANFPCPAFFGSSELQSGHGIRRNVILPAAVWHYNIRMATVLSLGDGQVATYEYHAIRAEGDKDSEKSFVGGIVVARDREEAKVKLRRHGLKATMLKRARGLMAVIKWFDADIR